MAAVNKSVLVGYSAAQMFALVDRVEDYPLFLPWCGGVNVQRPDADSMVASLSIHYHGIKQTFTTRNTSVSPVFIKMNLVDGPFKRLEGTFKLPEGGRLLSVEARLVQDGNTKASTQLVL